MIGDLVGSPYSFHPRIDPDDPDLFADHFTRTSMIELPDGTIALGYDGMVPGVVEFFDPDTGQETRFNEVLSDSSPFFGFVLPHDASFVSLAPLAGGGFVAGWLEEVPETVGFGRVYVNHTRLQVFDDAGLPQGAPLDISRTVADRIIYPDEPVTVAAANGVWLIQETAYESYAVTHYSATLAEQGATRIAAPDLPEAVELGSGRLAVLHAVRGSENGLVVYDAALQILGPDGTALGDPVSVGDTILPGARDARVHGIAGLEGGGAALLFSADVDGEKRLYAAVIGPDGGPAGSLWAPGELAAVPVDRSIGSGFTEMEITGLPGGGFAVGWKQLDADEDSTDNLPDTDVWLAAWDGDGALLVAPFRVNDVEAEEQGGIDLLVTAGDRLLVSYYDESEIGGGGPVKVQVVDLEGAAPPLPPEPIVGTPDPDRLEGTPGDDTIEGRAGDDTLLGMAGDDLLDGGTGRDRMVGGPGDDTYVLDHGKDKVVEAAGEGYDTIRASVKVALGKLEIERLELTGTADLRAVGNRLANEILGNDGDNVLVGGGGPDTLTGGFGADHFVIDYGSRGAPVTITDFGGGDRLAIDDRFFGGEAGIDLAIVTGQMMRNALASGRAEYDRATGALWLDPDGDAGAGDPFLVAILQGGPALSPEDLVLF